MTRRNPWARALTVVACASILAAPTSGVSAIAAPAPAHPDGALLSHYCFTCHNDQRKVGGLALDTKDLNHLGPDAQTWEAVVRKLNSSTRKRRCIRTPVAPRPCTV